MHIETRWISLEQVVVPSDARAHDPESLKELAADMAAEGQLQEIVVTPVSREQLAVSGGTQSADGSRHTANGFEVIAGAGRVAAARSLNWKEIRCSIRENVSDFDKVRITFAENADREDVDPFYQAGLLQRMMQAKNWTQRQLADALGKTEAYVSQYLALLKFSAEVQQYLSRLKLGLMQLLEISKVSGDEAQLQAAEAVQGKTKRETKQVINKHLEAQGKIPKWRKPAPSKDDPMAAIWAKIQDLPMNNAKWTVSYPEKELWRFEIHPNGGDYPGFLAEWFDNMAKAISANDPLLTEVPSETVAA
jgi:ParB/RepB/Spo0J family partition protein